MLAEKTIGEFVSAKNFSAKKKSSEKCFRQKFFQVFRPKKNRPTMFSPENLTFLAEKFFGRKIRRPYRRRRKQGGGPVSAPPGPSVVGSIGSIIRSVRSIIVQPTLVDRSGSGKGGRVTPLRYQGVVPSVAKTNGNHASI